MEQLYAFSAVNRAPVERTDSTLYDTIINIEKHNHEIIKNYYVKWFSLFKVPNLIFNHDQMLDKALKRLRIRTSINPIGFV